MGIADVRVDRGDGRLVSFTEEDAARFLKANPGAFRVAGRAAGDAPTAAENAATAALSAGAPNFAAMRKADLEAYAEEHGVDISSATNNDQRVALLEAAAEAQEPEETPA